MKKIMFNDKYGLTDAVLEGRKTMTRRIIPQSALDKVEEYQLLYYNNTFDNISFEDALYNMAYEGYIRSAYKVGEVVAIAQSYKSLAIEFGKRKGKRIDNKFDNYWRGRTFGYICDTDAGWTNKMFVKAEYMPCQIRITDIKVERLQDISDEDCLREGVGTNSDIMRYSGPKEAFANLIDKVSEKGTWDSNPYVFAYSFELVK